jgi:hypothetical protein
VPETHTVNPVTVVGMVEVRVMLPLTVPPARLPIATGSGVVFEMVPVPVAAIHTTCVTMMLL